MASGGAQNSVSESASLALDSFYCHQCEAPVEVRPDEFICTTCGSGFVEATTTRSPPPTTASEPNPIVDMLTSVLQAATNFSPEPSTSSRPGTSTTMGPMTFFTNLSLPGSQSHGAVVSGAGLDMEQLLRHIMTSFTAQAGNEHAFEMFGNPLDYAFSYNHLDNLVTHLLNEMENVGPPALPSDIIDTLPTIRIGTTHVEEKLQCAVCWEDFVLDEAVRQLTCNHLFHSNCIVPWLNLHATCPVCRAIINPTKSDLASASVADAAASSTERSTSAASATTSAETLAAHRPHESGARHRMDDFDHFDLE